MLPATREQIVECEDGVRLHGLYTPHPAERTRLAILIHGWHGDADSAYMVSSASHLWRQGFSVFRVHPRDHGPGHLLNRELFNSVRIAEVVSAVQTVNAMHPHRELYLGGFSLGGNFALRIALQAPGRGIPLRGVVAICPVLDPVRTMAALEANLIYHEYFKRKWRHALYAKLRCFPELGYARELARLDSLSQMNAFFVPRFTDFRDTRSYLEAYAITGERLAPLSVPSRIITSRDDPVIPSLDLERIARPASLTVEVTEFGGHCGFLRDWALRSWIDRRIEQCFVNGSETPADTPRIEFATTG